MVAASPAVMINAHRPEHAFSWIDATLPDVQDAPAVRDAITLPFWLLPPSEPVRVAGLDARRLAVMVNGSGNVVRHRSGPWRLQDTPWRDDPVQRDELPDGSARRRPPVASGHR